MEPRVRLMVFFNILGTQTNAWSISLTTISSASTTSPNSLFYHESVNAETGAVLSPLAIDAVGNSLSGIGDSINSVGHCWFLLADICQCVRVFVMLL